MGDLGQTKCIKGAIDLLSGDEIDMVLFQYLASGSFGTVMLGELSKRKGGGSKQVNCPAAVKSLRQSPPKGSNEEESSPLIYEANILSVSPHETLNCHHDREVMKSIMLMKSMKQKTHEIDMPPMIELQHRLPEYSSKTF